MITNLLISKLRTRFPHPNMHVITEPQAEIVIPAVHANIGGIKIYDDGNEITMCIGNFTHTHFANYEKSLSEAQAVEKISEAAVDFLFDLFADQIVLWGSHQGAGGFYRRGWKPTTPFSEHRGQEYVWSGPLPKKDQ
jgi:hypothetical protein